MSQFQALTTNVITAGIFTQTMHITCEIRMRQQRLTDFLSSIEEQFITVEKAQLANLADPGSAPRLVSFAQINRDSLIFATPYAGELSGDGSDQRRLVAINKQPRRVGLNVPPFLIHGDMHLLRETGLRDALLAVRQNFLPLTSAEAIHLPTGQKFTAATIIVSRNHVEAFYPGEEG